jgi:hypothetical protein
MTKLERIEREIESLDPDELARFREWFATHEAAEWDASIARDAADGRLESLAERALRDHKSGRTRAL